MIEKRWYMRVGNLGFNLIVLNMLWVIFTLLGLVVFGLFPATVALFSVLRKMILEDEDTAIFSEFVKQYKTEFKGANKIGYVVFLVGLFLLIDFRIIQNISQSNVQVILFNLTLVIGVFYLIAALYIFPVFVHFQLKWSQYFQYACIITIARPIQTIMLIALITGLIFLYMLVPSLVLVLGMSLMSFIVMKVATLSFPKANVIQES
ncbi:MULTISPECIES: YesL family protein [Gracilibacillus]|uniref:YesL family protein n=1 Tax=Gracilibacillus TaxID=74385 RepID=UPI00082605C9|nr:MULTISPECIES: DUF624 domain-containing protein [Gracilibacillus]